MFFRRLALFSTFVLAACSSSLQGVGDAVGLLRATRGNQQVDATQLNPRYRYLRVSVHGRSTLLVLGYVDPDRHGPVEVWYSGSGEVLRLQNGRLVGAAGLTVDWSNVHFSAYPHWSDIASPLTLTRSRDVMPGYAYGVTDTLQLRPIAPPARTDLADLRSNALQWYEEDARGLRPARYAVMREAGETVVVYGEQCLSNNFCLSWQRWPAHAMGQSDAR